MPIEETQLKIACILLPVRDVEMMSAFYRDVLGFTQIASREPSDVCFDLGAMSLCLHHASAPMRDDATIGPTLVFNVSDVATMREQLAEQGVHMGKLKSFGAHQECDGRDPEGNLFRLSSQD